MDWRSLSPWQTSHLRNWCPVGLSKMLWSCQGKGPRSRSRYQLHQILLNNETWMLAMRVPDCQELGLDNQRLWHAFKSWGDLKGLISIKIVEVKIILLYWLISLFSLFPWVFLQRHSFWALKLDHIPINSDTLKIESFHIATITYRAIYVKYPVLRASNWFYWWFMFKYKNMMSFS